MVETIVATNLTQARNAFLDGPTEVTCKDGERESICKDYPSAVKFYGGDVPPDEDAES